MPKKIGFKYFMIKRWHEENMKQKYPKLNIVGKIAPPFSPLSIKEEMDYFDRISALKPTFIWLGLGSPKQVIFGARLKKKITGCKIFCVGAGFDFIAKNKQQAPRLLQKIGLEWMFRLFTEPKRLWKRYLVTIGFYYMTHYRALITLLGNKCMKNQ